MAEKAVVAVGVGAVGVAVGLVARALVKKDRGSDGDGAHPEGWKAVTVLGDAEDFQSGGEYPEPLQRLAGALEVRIEPAPGDKGFEVHARVREGADLGGEEDPAKALRTALRDAKQVFETGEVLRATPRPHGERPRTLLGGAVDKAEDDAKGEGVLEAVFAARKGGSLFVLGVFGGFVDKFPLGAVMNKGLTLRSAQQHGHRYIPMLLERMARDELVTEHLATHVMPLAEAPAGYAMFKEKTDGCVRAVFRP